MSEQPGQGDGIDTPPRDHRPSPMGRPPVGSPAYQAGRRAMWLGGGALVISLFFFPIGAVLGIAAVVVGVKARRLARAERVTTAQGVVPGIVMGAIGLCVCAMSLAFAAFMWPQVSSYQECLGGANTHTDKKACKDEYKKDLQNKEKKYNLPKDSLSRYSDLF
ncbi:hypothetical protein [Spirillospora sp. CA-294931]|uniref:hypothetical protein n=1 Tax=Spirillospora sp. CA-294931 TaxID=3240042 RepID=UPI003D914E5E